MGAFAGQTVRFDLANAGLWATEAPDVTVGPRRRRRS
jgi:hypothetical protein